MKIPQPYMELDDATRDALLLEPEQLKSGLADKLTVHSDNDAMIRQMAEVMLADFQAARVAPDTQVAFIVPVGPVGQYDRLAALCAKRDLSLENLTLIVMDEYLTNDGGWISETDPLSFRAHIQKHLLNKLPKEMHPTVVVPDPLDLGSVQRAIDNCGGVTTSFAGVGITGHLAFNEPIDGITNAAHFAGLPTRIIQLLPQTRLINAVTAARGNVDRIPRMAVTVGMKEILAAERVRLFMNRRWQAAAVRRLALGPVTAAFPASLVQTHPDWSVDVTSEVLALPEPELA